MHKGEVKMLMPGQRLAIGWLNDRRIPASLILMPPGTGKTIVAHHWISSVPCLIICRRDDFITWEAQLGTKKCHRIDNEHYVAAPPASPMYTLVTYDLLKNERIMEYLRSVPWHRVIADEIQQIKHHDTDRAKAFHKFTRTIPNRLGLTGTEITNEVSDIFSLALFADGGKTFGTDYWAFMNTYYIKEGYRWYMQRDAKARIIAKLPQIAFSINAQEAGLILPPKRHILKSVIMTAAQSRHYNNLITQMATDIAMGTYELDYVTAQMGKLRQIASGFMYITEKLICPRCEGTGNTCAISEHCAGCGGKGFIVTPRRTITFPCNKIELVRRMVTEDLKDRKKLVIWCAHTATIKRIHKALTRERVKCVVFHGSDAKRNDAARKAFAYDKKIRVFIGQEEKGVGMNELICSNTAIYVENSHKVAARIQSEARTARKGSEIHEFLEVYDLITEGTMDLPILETVLGKRKIAQEIHDRVAQLTSKSTANVRQILTELSVK